MTQHVKITQGTSPVSLFEDTLITYLNEQNGHFVVLSNDATFLTLLRMTISKQLGLNYGKAFTVAQVPNAFMDAIDFALSVYTDVVLVIEQTLNGADMTHLLAECTNRYNLKTLMVVSNPDRNKLLFAHEMGAANFILKPASINALITKLAVTVKPHGRFAQELQQARATLEKGDADTCLQLCNILLMEHPDNMTVHTLMGDALKAKDRLDLAESYYKQASHGDTPLIPLGKLAELYAELDDQMQRLACLQHMDTLSPLNVYRKMDMSELEIILGREEQAHELFETIISHISKDQTGFSHSLMQRITTVCAKDDPALAEYYLRKNIESRSPNLTEHDVVLFNQLGIALRLQGKWQEAVTEYTRALRLSTNEGILFYNIAMAYTDDHQFSTAHQYVLKALKSNPRLSHTNERVALNIAKVFMAASDIESAVEQLTLALEHFPHLDEAREMLQSLQ